MCNHDFAAQMEAIDDGGCPLCLKDAAADLERRVEAQATNIKTYQQVCARLEEEKAQIDACAAQWARENAALVDRLAQAETREAAMRRVLDVFWRDRVKLNLPLDYQAMLPEVLSPDAGRKRGEEGA